jgi:hypothetical protein
MWTATSSESNTTGPLDCPLSIAFKQQTDAGCISTCSWLHRCQACLQTPLQAPHYPHHGLLHTHIWGGSLNLIISKEYWRRDGLIQILNIYTSVDGQRMFKECINLSWTDTQGTNTFRDGVTIMYIYDRHPDSRLALWAFLRWAFMPSEYCQCYPSRVLQLSPLWVRVCSRKLCATKHVP